MIKRYRYQTHDNCPRCNSPNEDTQHVIKCQHPVAKELWETELNSTLTWMLASDIEPDIATSIISNLQGWYKNDFPTTSGTNNHLVSQAIRKQTHIGWKSFLEGFWVKEWEQAQNIYFKEKSSPKSTELLISKAQRRIWKIAWPLWLHRNEILHETQKSIHPQEMINLDEEVQYEWNKGLDQLPQTHHHKFTVSLDDLLRHNCTSKINWLFSIWAARETKDPTYLSTQIHRHSQPALKFKYVAWKTRIST